MSAAIWKRGAKGLWHRCMAQRTRIAELRAELERRKL